MSPEEGQSVSFALTCSAAVAIHAQAVAALGVAHAEALVHGVGRVPLVPQVHPQLVLALRSDFVQVLQTCGKEGTFVLMPNGFLLFFFSIVSVSFTHIFGAL